MAEWKVKPTRRGRAFYELPRDFFWRNKPVNEQLAEFVFFWGSRRAPRRRPCTALLLALILTLVSGRRSLCRGLGSPAYCVRWLRASSSTSDVTETTVCAIERASMSQRRPSVCHKTVSVTQQHADQDLRRLRGI